MYTKWSKTFYYLLNDLHKHLLSNKFSILLSKIKNFILLDPQMYPQNADVTKNNPNGERLIEITSELSKQYRIIKVG